MEPGRIRRGVLRRPARGEAEEPPGREEPVWEALNKIALDTLHKRQKVVIEGMFWEAPVMIAGEVRGVIVNEGDTTWRIWVTGTQQESLLKELGGQCQEMRVHICSDPCDRLVWARDLIHGHRYHVPGGEAEGWHSNLAEVSRERAAGGGGDDPLHRLRQEMGERTKGGEIQYSPEHAGAPEGKREVEEERPQKKGKKRKTKVRAQLEAGIKEVFKHTALDPDIEIRRELMKKARKIRKGKKKKKKSSRSRSKGTSGEDSGDSSESTSLAEKHIAGSELFESERRSLQIWRRVPGALLNATILDMQEQMITAHGYTNRPVEEGAVAPVATQYFRSHLQQQMGAALARESLHLATIIDLSLRGRIASALDVAGQRLKALEAMSRGTTIEIARRLELVGPERPSLVSVPEAGAAGRELQVEDRVMRRNTNRWPWEDRDSYKGGKGRDKGKRDKGRGDGKSKDKGHRKGDGKKKDDKGDKE